MIAGYVGANGSGKTLLAVTDVLKISKRFPERPILSTVPLDVPQYVELKSWQQIVDAEPPFILMLDEVAALADARSTMTLPPHVLLYIGSLRHRDVVCFWTAPAWSWCDVRLRAVTTEAHECVAFFRPRRKGQAWKQTVISVVSSRATNLEQGDKLPDRDGLPRVKVLPWQKGFGHYPTARDPMAISEFARICPECGLPKRKRDAYCRGSHSTQTHSDGITSIASSNAGKVLAVKPHAHETQSLAGAASTFPDPAGSHRLDGSDGPQ